MSQKFSSELRRKALEMKSRQNQDYFSSDENEFEEKIQTIADFLRTHIEEVGIEQAVKDFQTGLTCLCKGKPMSVLEEKQPLEEDGDFGEKTFAALVYACEHYSLETILNYLQRGAFTNAVFDTKNDTDVNTDELACKVCAGLELEE